MKRRIEWPGGHAFAFTVVDDTDGGTLANIKPVYDYLWEKGLRTTKTCWPFPPKDSEKYKGECLQDRDYAEYLRELEAKGFEMAFHNAGSGGHTREETLAGLELFRETFGHYPRMHINHANCPENMYWGASRFHWPVSSIYRRVAPHVKSYGHVEDSEFFWGDACKEHMTYMRNRTFNGLNTLKEDQRLVYPECGKGKYSNDWFSSSDGMNVERFRKIMTRKNIDRLIREGGCCILYTHFAYRFVDETGALDPTFREAIDYISQQNGWFAPASEILDYVKQNKSYAPSKWYEWRKDIKWLIERVNNK